MSDYDLFIIGAGPGGIAASRLAGQRGVRVAVAEQESIGGTCVNRGCVPKKLMVYAADMALRDRVANSYGWSRCQRYLDWSYFLNAIHQHINQIHQSYLQKFEQWGVDLMRGRAALIDAHTLIVDGCRVTADKILIAVGSHPLMVPLPGIEYAITSREMFHLPQIPTRFVVIGGGYVGVEFASMMNAFGSEALVIEKEAQILHPFEETIRQQVQQGLRDRGICVLCNSSAKTIQRTDEGWLQVQVAGETEQTLNADTVLVAVGRVPNTKDLGLDRAGVAVGDQGEIQVDEYSRTSQDHIFAVGDCTNRLPLTPVAKAEAWAAIETVFGQQPQKLDYDYIPSAVFSRPEGATVGLSEAKARDRFGDSVHCYYNQLTPLLYSLMPDKNASEQAMLKLVVEGDTERVLGAHMVGEHAADIIESLAVAIRQGITKQDLDRTIGIHPTIGEEFLTMP